MTRGRTRSWADLPDADLLKVRLKDLDLKVEGTWLEGCLSALNDELAQRGLRVQPHAWISDEWFSPDSTPGIAFPFYLAHPRLMRLERKMMFDVEGGTRTECMRILRHEAGHVVQHAFGLHRRKRWQQHFGRSSTRYPNYYRANPASRNFVQHLRLWYAQSHPDEDFAETFAVWLSPRTNWRKRYAGWPALKKLEYVDELMHEIAGTKPALTRRIKVDPLSRLSTTLGEHYEKQAGALRRRALARPTTANSCASSPPMPATANRHRLRPSSGTTAPACRRLVSKWTGEYQLTLDAVLDEMIERCRELKLRASGSEAQLRLDFTVLLTAETMRSLYSPSRRQWLAV